MQQNDNQKLAVEEHQPDNESNVPDWQLVAMLHYEYARCSKLMLQAVNDIRNPDCSKSKEFALPFANYLARRFPEFPKTPWEKIESNVRVHRLADCGIDEQNGLYSFAPAWEFLEIFGAQAEALEGELTELAGESYGVFRIDFRQKDAVIINQFSRWLQDRRAHLIHKYDSAGKLAEDITWNENDRFRGRSPAKLARGGGAPAKKYRLALTALGNLRAFISAERDVHRARKTTATKDLSSWQKYEIYTGRMMMCVESVWRYHTTFGDVFDAAKWLAPIGSAKFIRPPRALDEPRKGKAEQVRRFLDQHFTLAELKYV